MNAFFSFAPIYLNGMLALYVAFFLPGIVIARAMDIANFPQRWLAVVLSSLAGNHLLVTMIAALHINPLLTYRLVVIALVATLLYMTATRRARSEAPSQTAASILLPSDLGWLFGTLIVLGFSYFNVWKHGVPNIFQGSDVSVSWNAWALIWSQGSFPTASYGYPQLVPSIWAVTYIFTGSTEQYFAYYTHIILIMLPITLCTVMLSRSCWQAALCLLIVFVWFIAEIREPWLRSTLQEGFPDWIAAIFSLCGVALFAASAPAHQLDREKVVGALLSLCLVSIAAATKPLCGLLAIAILIAVCTDASKHLERRERNRFVMAALVVVLVFVAAYAVNYLHLTVRSMPYYPVTEWTDRLSRAARQLNSNFTLPFRLLMLAGLVLSPFLPRIRWLTLPLLAGLLLWTNTASYDLRNLLGFAMICAFIPPYALVRRFAATDAPRDDRQWQVRDSTVAIGLAAACFALTMPLAMSDERLQQRFHHEQLSKGMGLELNQNIERLLVRGCTVFSADGYITTISAFKQFREQIQFYHFTEPLNDALVSRVEKGADCIGFLYPPERIHPTVRLFMLNKMEARGDTIAVEHNGMKLLATP